ncbi:MAG: hypothetical protein JWR06_103 [Jatrophihabitans sp.]|jgi:hypothetical protein|nr:hypothetical protein [Jatrophihabitans sp.]MCW2655910.1 hypothetical protein [Jatrophihabitans sp.]
MKFSFSLRCAIMETSEPQTNRESKDMITSGSRPFTAATNKLAYAQAFAGSNGQRPRAHRTTKLRLRRGLTALRRSGRA